VHLASPVRTVLHIHSTRDPNVCIVDVDDAGDLIPAGPEGH
jgi:hypothetical protein